MRSEAELLYTIQTAQDELTNHRMQAVINANSLAELAAVSIDGYSVEGSARKAKFHSLARRKLRRLANALDLTAKDYRLSSNKAGIAVCGEITLHTDNFYLQVSQNSLGIHREIMYRRCDGRKDYTGGQNNFASVALLDGDLGLMIQHMQNTRVLPLMVD